MDPARSAAGASESPLRDPFDGLHAEAKAALGYAANSLRAIRDRYRETYHAELGRWHALRDELDGIDSIDLRSPSPGLTGTNDEAAVLAAEAGAEDARVRALRRTVQGLAEALGTHERELSRLDLAERNLERTWLFLERDDATLVGDAATDAPAGDGAATLGGGPDAQMRILEAQEAERGRLAQDVHDGPAQALTNAIFQVEYVERVLDTDLERARTEVRLLRDLLRRELDDVRTFITHLRPPLLDRYGLDGAIADAAMTMAGVLDIPIDASLTAPAERLGEAEQTVVLRVVQEALQNVRKHAAAHRVTVSSRMAGTDWVLEVRDDGRGFDVGAVAARGRRNFGLQFMRERAELIGARFEVRSRPTAGTVVVLTIPTGGKR